MRLLGREGGRLNSTLDGHALPEARKLIWHAADQTRPGRYIGIGSTISAHASWQDQGAAIFCSKNRRSIGLRAKSSAARKCVRADSTLPRRSSNSPSVAK